MHMEMDTEAGWNVPAFVSCLLLNLLLLQLVRCLQTSISYNIPQRLQGYPHPLYRQLAITRAECQDRQGCRRANKKSFNSGFGLRVSVTYPLLLLGRDAAHRFTKL
eukprot:TRINITY_DN5663_c1_g1_i1.p3 TRINITY_DN5663_c1_g1~~TRINITY_DN5663_c1_g1_i1.p3  ORF type:complete len:106 (+),score=3.45 TRINITY_DN5663_c1_g1_i1:111-428(+)